MCRCCASVSYPRMSLCLAISRLMINKEVSSATPGVVALP